MSGLGEQRIMVAPKYDIMVVFNGWNIHEPENPVKSPRFVLQDLIIPAIKEL